MINKVVALMYMVDSSPSITRLVIVRSLLRKSERTVMIVTTVRRPMSTQTNWVSKDEMNDISVGDRTYSTQRQRKCPVRP